MDESLFSVKREQLSEAETHSNTAGESRPQTGGEPSISLDKRQSLPERIVVCAVAGKWRMRTRQPCGLILVHNKQPGKVQAMVLQWAIMLWRTHGSREVLGAADPHLKAKFKKKRADFVKTVISNVLRALGCSLNQPLKSADDWYSGILRNATKTMDMKIFFFQLV